MIVHSRESSETINIATVYKVSESALTSLETYAAPDFKIIRHSTEFKLLSTEYTKTHSELTNAYQSIIKLEKELKDISYKFSSISFDNDELSAKINLIDSKTEKAQKVQIIDKEENELKKQNDRIDPTKIGNKQCNQCQTFSIIKDDLKLLKQENHQKIALIQYEHEIAKRKISETRHNLEVLQEENIRLKEENKLLRATSTIYTSSADIDET